MTLWKRFRERQARIRARQAAGRERLQALQQARAAETPEERAAGIRVDAQVRAEAWGVDPDGRADRLAAREKRRAERIAIRDVHVKAIKHGMSVSDYRAAKLLAKEDDGE